MEPYCTVPRILNNIILHIEIISCYCYNIGRAGIEYRTVLDTKSRPKVDFFCILNFVRQKESNFIHLRSLKIISEQKIPWL